MFPRYSFLEQCLLLSEKHAVISAYLFAYLWTEFYQQEPCIILHFPADSSKQKQLERLIFKPLFLGDNWQKSFLSEKKCHTVAAIHWWFAIFIVKLNGTIAHRPHNLDVGHCWPLEGVWCKKCNAALIFSSCLELSP